MKLRHAAALGAATSLALVSPALGAAVPTDVEVGGSGAQAEHPITATSIGKVRVGAEDRQRPGFFQRITCSSASIPAEPTSTVASGSAVTSIIKIAKASFICESADEFNYTVYAYGNWSFKRTSGTGTSAQTDEVKGRVFNVRFAFRHPDCRYVVEGTAAATFDEATQVLHVDESGGRAEGLKITKVFGCGANYVVGAAYSVRADLQINSPDGPINAVS